MKIYNYHPETKLYLGESVADESPLEKGVYLIPAHATSVKPPEKMKDKVIMFDNDKWVYVDIPQNNEIPKIKTEEDVKNEKKHNMLRELQLLDIEIPEIVEYIVEQGDFQMPKKYIDKINRKKELRLELQNIT